MPGCGLGAEHTQMHRTLFWSSGKLQSVGETETNSQEAWVGAILEARTRFSSESGTKKGTAALTKESGDNFQQEGPLKRSLDR